MKKFIIVLLLLIFWSNSSFAASIYGKKGKGPLKITTRTANTLEYYFSGGTRGAYKQKQDRAWKPFFIVISVDGKEFSYFVMPDSYSGSFAPGNYVGQALQECKKLSGKECFVFADKYKIIWDNGSDKKKRRLKRKDIKAGKTLQILQELGFYDGGITQTKKIEKKLKKKKESKKKTNDDIVQKIKDLKELYDSGALTKEEFEKAKKKLLN